MMTQTPPMQASSQPGRTCPLHYHYGPDVFREAQPPQLRDLEVLYLVGGLYGNALALDEALRLFDAEQGRKRLVFNGDFHWFDVDPSVFERVQREVLAHTALRGNVETELSGPEAVSDAGCGCAYPDWVADGVVDRSNRILQRLWGAATAAHRAQLADLPMWLTASVGEARVGIVHGDAESLAGWGFAQEHLRDAAHRERVSGWFERAGVDVFACSHTCLPVFQPIRRGGAATPGWVLNNGAAGMPNFRGDAAGLLTRISVTPFRGPERRAGIAHNGLHFDAIAIEADPVRVRQAFLAQCPEGSDAHASYFGRIVDGPDHLPEGLIRGDETAS
jgi:hypothetical protein